MKEVEINTNESEHKEDSSKEKFNKEKAEFEKTNKKYISNEVNIVSQDLQISKTTPNNNNRAGRKPKNEEHRECESGTSKEHKKKFETEEENNQTWRVSSYRQRKKNKKALELCEKQIMHGNEQDYLDEIWSIIKRVIIEVANKSLPKKKMRFIRDRLGLLIEETDKLEFNLTIEKINTDLQLEIQQAEDI
ncbi:21662_t:CDS:2 [Gigaspora margarita]|uniref:21662_t:CDS:1 n=1 Tax=Gigaspora margarita TaxID=4874 RepID=A0ABN7WC50_GIGMA|nr:21662_t:CDS:2 [Gigaspora margarita]